MNKSLLTWLQQLKLFRWQAEEQILPAFLQLQWLVLHFPLHEHVTSPLPWPPTIDSFLAASLSEMIFIDSHPFNASVKPFNSTLLPFPAVTRPSLWSHTKTLTIPISQQQVPGSVSCSKVSLISSNFDLIISRFDCEAFSIRGMVAS